MNLIVAGLLLHGLACQDAAPIFHSSESAAGWTLSGAADVEDETELNVRARRVVRRYDMNRKLFTEALSDSTTLRTMVDASKKRFEGTLKPGPTGRYGATLSTHEKLLHSEKLVLGPVGALFVRGPEDVKTILEAAEKSTEFLDEIERVLKGQAGNTAKDREAYLARVNKLTRKLEDLCNKCDLLGTIQVLLDALFHIRNAQIWEEAAKPVQGDNDPARIKKKVFTDLDLSIDDLRRILGMIPGILSSEIKVSTSLILERLIAQARDIETRREASRAAVRSASKFAEAAPVPDKDFIQLLDQASDKGADPTETRGLLHAAGTSLLVQQ
ncbi:MAG TPA: hypothetical protein VJU16_00405 [Planctomycetota bacterium]|nr:hypothetical protein [Planctomycetota bacterium]